MKAPWGDEHGFFNPELAATHAVVVQGGFSDPDTEAKRMILDGGVSAERARKWQADKARQAGIVTHEQEKLPEPQHRTLLGHLVHHRDRVADKVGGDLAATATALSKPRAKLLSGQYIRNRFVQSLVWSVIAGLIGAQFVFGLYDGVMEIHWFIHIGSFYLNLFYLKPGWDSDCFGLVHSANWSLYRHLAFRDIPGPAFATMAVTTLLSKPKWWDKKVSTLRVVTAPVVIIALTFAMGVAGVWLGYFGLPDAWHHLFGSYTLPDTAWLGKASAVQLALGFVIGRVLHRYWAPVGATLQSGPLDRSVDRWQVKIKAAGMSLEDAIRYNNAGLHILPVWQRLPIAPPVLRERWALMWRSNKALNARSGHGRVVMTVCVLAFLIVALGFVGHYVAGEGVSVPYLFPGG